MDPGSVKTCRSESGWGLGLTNLRPKVVGVKPKAVINTAIEIDLAKECRNMRFSTEISSPGGSMDPGILGT